MVDVRLATRTDLGATTASGRPRCLAASAAAVSDLSRAVQARRAPVGLTDWRAEQPGFCGLRAAMLAVLEGHLGPAGGRPGEQPGAAVEQVAVQERAEVRALDGDGAD